MSEGEQRFYEFGVFLLDARERLLFRDGEPLDMTPKVFDILLELVRGGGRVVEKKELMERVWPDSFVEESNLTQHISTLRKKLAHSEKDRYILTVPGRGYRFIPSVRGWDDDAVVTVHERLRARILVEEEAGERSQLGQPEGDEETGLAAAGTTASGRIATRLARAPASLQAPAQPALKRRGWLIASLIFALAATLGFVVYKSFLGGRVAPFEKTKLVRFTNTGKVTSAAISPDGKYVAYSVADAGRESLWVRQVITSGGGIEVIPPDEFHFQGLSFSPDSNYLYYVGARKGMPSTLQRVPALGGATPTHIMEDVDSPPAFSPDGKRMAYVRGYPDQKETALLIAGADGTNERKLTSLKEGHDRFGILNTGPSWSPDGKSIAYAAGGVDERGEYQALFEARVEDGGVKQLTSERWQKIGRAAWLADGRSLVLLAADQESALSQVWRVSYPEGSVRKVTNDLSDYSDLSVTADSRAMAVVESDQRANLWLVPEADTGRAVQISSNNYDGIQGMAWTPDGRIIYSTAASTAQELWVTNADGSNQRQLTENVGFSRGLTVSPDGRYAVFVSTRDGKEHLWRVDADGSHLQQLTTGVHDLAPVFSPEGQWVVYRSGTFGSPNLFKVPVGGGEPVRLTEKISGPPAVSPDGKLIAFGYRENTQTPLRLALIPFEGGTPVRLLDPQPVPDHYLFQWTNDRLALCYVNTRGGVSNIWLQPVEGGKSAPLTSFDSQRIFRFALSMDGHKLAVSRGQVTNDVVLINSVE